MNCAISDTEWIDYLDQALPFRERQNIDAHLRLCTPCRSELDRLRQVDQRLRIECGLIRQSLPVSPEAGERVLAALLDSGLNSAPDGVAAVRLWRVRWVLALLCGSNTATRIISAAERHAIENQPAIVAGTKPNEQQKWQLFLRRLSFLTTEICGCYAGDLIMAVGK